MITIIDIGPNALAAVLAVVGLLTSAIAIWRAERIASMHAVMQQQVDRNETYEQARVSNELKDGKR